MAGSARSGGIEWVGEIIERAGGLDVFAVRRGRTARERTVSLRASGRGKPGNHPRELVRETGGSGLDSCAAGVRGARGDSRQSSACAGIGQHPSARARRVIEGARQNPGNHRTGWRKRQNPKGRAPVATNAGCWSRFAESANVLLGIMPLHREDLSRSKKFDSDPHWKLDVYRSLAKRSRLSTGGHAVAEFVPA